ncbi:hypothetical protein [Janthinobacterium sp.]|uniref:hypothetical protein n=1 Tax=Janthinobacterium sp. TaxID=1871054 RepID=UPI0026183EF1|nr:hypothetical protein [Janthinobacterium sp.]
MNNRFKIGQIVKQNTTPDLIIIVTSVYNDKFSGRVLLNEQNVYECNVGDLVEDNNMREFSTITNSITFGKDAQKFQVGDFIRCDDETDGTYWTAMVTKQGETKFSSVIITSTSFHTKPGDEWSSEHYDDWRLSTVDVEVAPKFTVGDRVSSKLIMGDNMLTVTEVADDELGTFSAVVVRNAMNPAQEGELYTDLIPSTFTPYESK